MNDDLAQYKDLIRQIETLPQASMPAEFTHQLMGKINGSIWQMLFRTFEIAGKYSWMRFAGDGAKGQNAFFNFLIAGLFFMVIGTVLLSSMLYMDHPSGNEGFIILQALLIIMAAVSLVAGGTMMAVDGPDAVLWSGRAIMVYGLFMTLSAILVAVNVKSNMGGLLAIILAAVGVLTGLSLKKTLEDQGQGNHGPYGEHLNNV